jgi:hypothetical protein
VKIVFFQNETGNINKNLGGKDKEKAAVKAEETGKAPEAPAAPVHFLEQWFSTYSSC